MRPSDRARADAAARGADRASQAIAVCAARLRHRQRQRVHERDACKAYCDAAGIEFTRRRPYRKNDQAWVEQKNGAVVRRLVGYRRLEGLEAARRWPTLPSSRLFVNFFQPSFKLIAKRRDGARVRKTYSPPMTPHQRLAADIRTPDEVREQDHAFRWACDRGI